MKTVEEIKARCEIFPHDNSPQKEHWLWQGAFRSNRKGKKTASCSAPDYSKDPTGKTSTVQSLMRAIRHITTGNPIKAGLEAARTCPYGGCVSPDCTKWMTRKQRGAYLRRTGELRGNTERDSKVVAARWTAARRKITPEKHQQILSDSRPATQVGPDLGLHHTTVSWVRRGGFKGIGAMSNPFAGLMR